MLEHFLERVSVSEYLNNFIIKGGFLIASMVGLDSRAPLLFQQSQSGPHMRAYLRENRQVEAENCEKLWARCQRYCRRSPSRCQSKMRAASGCIFYCPGREPLHNRWIDICYATTLSSVLLKQFGYIAL